MNWTKIFEQVSKIEVKNITDPLFKYALCAFALAVIYAIFKSADWIAISLFSIGGVLVLAGLCSYVYFAKKNPDYLRSESFQISKQSIEMLGDKDNQLNPNVKSIIHIASPFTKELNDGQDPIKLGE